MADSNDNDFIRLLREQEKILGRMRSNVHYWMNELLQSAFNPEMFLQFAARMGVDLSQLPNLTKKQDGFEPYRVLGLEHTATDATVKTRYRELLKNLHPDTSTVKGTDFLLQVVIAAYQHIAEERGFSK